MSAADNPFRLAEKLGLKIELHRDVQDATHWYMLREVNGDGKQGVLIRDKRGELIQLRGLSGVTKFLNRVSQHGWR